MISYIIASHLTRPIGLSETEAINEAIEASLLTFEADIKDGGNYQLESPDVTAAAMIDCVKDHVSNVLSGDTRRIVVSRLRMWETSNAFFKRKWQKLGY